MNEFNITLLRTVPRIPIKQCSFVRTNTASVLSSLLRRRAGIAPPFFHPSISAWFVLTQTISSARLKPHLCKRALPISNKSLLGSQRKRKLGVAARDSIGREAKWVISEKCSLPPSSEMTITSKRKPCAGGWMGDGRPRVSLLKRFSLRQSILSPTGGWDRWKTSCFFKSVNLYVSKVARLVKVKTKENWIIQTFVIWDNPRNSGDKGSEFHFEVLWKRTGSG
jgi:hypothetical protein